MYHSTITHIPDIDLFLTDYKQYEKDCTQEGLEPVSLIEFAEEAEAESRLKLDYLAY